MIESIFFYLSHLLTFYLLLLPVNLSGDCRQKILDHKLNLSCSKYLPTTDAQIPTGEKRSVENTPFDFLKDLNYGTRIGNSIPLIDGGGQPGIDHCFVVDGFNELNPVMCHVGTLTDESTGRQLICSSTMPSVQIYTGNFLSKNIVDEPYTQHNAVCLETQHYPDSPNQPTFPSTLLRPGQEYKHKTVFSFRTIA
jgi:aldose 1-epimerase